MDKDTIMKNNLMFSLHASVLESNVNNNKRKQLKSETENKEERTTARVPYIGLVII